MKYGIWKVSQPEAGAVNALVGSGYAPLAAMVLASRGMEDDHQARAYLDCNAPLLDPFLMTDMDKAAGRVGLAMSRGEKIAVFGDYDVDGITATCLLTDFLRRHGADAVSYIPGRLEEGYGLNPIAIHQLHDEGVKLIVTVDCGITAVSEAELCRQLGIDLVITDHHECKQTLPAAAAVVDPHRPDGGYPHKNLSGVGVAFKLASALCGSQETVLEEYADMVCLGTVADVMPLQGENRVFVARGLESLAHTKRPGIAALMAECGCAPEAVSASSIGFMLAPRINAAGRMGQIDLAVELFLTDDPDKAAEAARGLCELNRQRQAVESEIYRQAVSMLPMGKPPEAIVLADESWHQGVVGIVASRLSEKYSRPSFMIHLNGGVGKGSCRSWGGFNLFAALESCQDLLLGFGGHELAAGFTIEEGNIPAFRARMNQYARKFCGGQTPVSVLDVDVPILHPGRVTLQEVEELRALEPYGAGNSRPLFCLQGATLDRAQNVGQNRHLKVRLSKGSAQFDGIFFSATAEQCGCRTGCRVDAAFYLQVNEFRGNRSVQMQIVDIRPSLCGSAREGESLHLMERCMAGETLLPKEAVRLLPSREQFVRLWRMLERTVPKEGVQTPYLPYIRVLAEELPGAEPFLRAAFCLEIFRERGLVSLARSGDDLTLRLTRGDRKISLGESAYLQTLQRTLHATHSGGDTQ